MDEKTAQQASLKQAVTPYVDHLQTTLDEPKIKVNEVKISPDGASMGEQILNNQEYVFQRPLRTYQGDIADALKSQNASVATIAIAEKVKKEKIEKIAEAHPMMPAPRSPALKNMALFLLSIALLGGGGYLVYAFYYVPRSQVPPPPKLTVPSIIMPDSQIEVPVSLSENVSLADILRAQFVKVTGAQNAVTHLYLTKSTGERKNLMSAQELLALLGTQAPEEYLRTINPQFMLGVHSYNGNKPFIVLKTTVYQNAFAGMLKWEKTMADDLLAIFSQTPTTPDAPLPSPITTADILTSAKSFTDLVIKNKDVRALTNEYDRIVLLYTFLDKETILITTNEFTLTELLDRMTNRRFIR